MLFTNLAAASLLFVIAVAEPGPSPYRIGTMSMNPAIGLTKRQAGYQPTQTQCGTGNTCAEACGTGYETCPSTDGELHCFDPAIQDTCCPDGTGNSCATGYFCTQDTSGGTWCCPNGMSLAACAAAYSLTGTLASETPTSTPTTSVSGGSVGSTTTTTVPSTTTSIATTASSTTAQIPLTTGAGTLSTTAVVVNATITSAKPTNAATPTTTVTPTTTAAKFTGAASANGVANGLMALFIAGAVAIL